MPTSSTTQPRTPIYHEPEVSYLGWGITLAVAFLVHAAVLLIARNAPAHGDTVPAIVEIDVAAEDAPTSAAVPTPPDRVAVGAAPLVAPPAPAPAARAQVANALTAPDDGKGDESNAITTGNAERYAGGLSSSDGSSAEAVSATAEPVVPPAPPPPPPPAPSVDTVALTRDYLNRIRGAIASQRHYPSAAQKGGIQGTVVVSFSITSQGTFSNVAVATSSGSEILDRAALGSVASLSGRIPRPKEIGGTSLPLKVALRFEIDS